MNILNFEQSNDTTLDIPDTESYCPVELLMVSSRLAATIRTIADYEEYLPEESFAIGVFYDTTTLEVHFINIDEDFAHENLSELEDFCSLGLRPLFLEIIGLEEEGESIIGDLFYLNEQTELDMQIYTSLFKQEPESQSTTEIK